MTDQKVTPCEFVAGLCSNCGESERGECEGWVAPDDRVQSLADQVEALTKERDEYKLLGDAIAAGHKECVRCLGEALQDTANVAVERDALAVDAARYQWVKKQTRAFSLDMGGKHSWAVTGGFMRAKGSSLDEAIDAAIQEAGVQ